MVDFNRYNFQLRLINEMNTEPGKTMISEFLDFDFRNTNFYTCDSFIYSGLANITFGYPGTMILRT